MIKSDSWFLWCPVRVGDLNAWNITKMMVTCEKTQSLHWNHFWSWMLDIFDFSPHLDSTKGSFTIMHQPEIFRHNVGIGIPILTISYRVTPQWGQYIHTYIINIYYYCSQKWYLPLYISHMCKYIYIYPHSARLHRIIYPVPLDSRFNDVCKWWEATAIAGLNCRPSESRQNL